MRATLLLAAPIFTIGALGDSWAFSAPKKYRLLNSKGEEYLSSKMGTLGGHRALKIYGRLDCPSALRWIAKGKYVKNRVFFASTQSAIAAGYRPCAICQPEAYRRWKATQTSATKKSS